MEIVFAGLDGEMTGLDISSHKLIQIGIAFSKNDKYVSQIGWDKFLFDHKSLKVMGVDKDDVQKWKKPNIVDQEIVTWLKNKNIKKHSIIPVGWEVAAFDRPFVKKTLPKFYEYLHHHSIELNSISYTFGDTMPYFDSRPNSYYWKKMAKFAGVFSIKCEEARWPKNHDAGDNAIASLESWKWLRNIILDKTLIKGENISKQNQLYKKIKGVDATKGYESYDNEIFL